MIKLFRNTRKKLLREGKTANYLKYAVSEIILVVIGILIALSINNWKQNQNKKALTLNYLEDFKNDLINDTIVFNSAIERATKTIAKDQSILKIKDLYAVPVDSLGDILRVHHSMRIYQINNSTYSKLLNTGFTESKMYGDLYKSISLYYTKEFRIYSEYIEWDKEETIDFVNSDFLGESKNIVDLTVLRQNLDLNSSKNQDENNFNGIIEFIESNEFRNRLTADYIRKKLVVERILIQKQIATDLLKKIDDKLYQR